VVKEKPILFSTAMVQAILAGRKTQTRRVVEVANPDEWEGVNDCRASEYGAQVPCCLFRKKATEKRGVHYPRYDVGDILWVRETWQRVDCGIDPDLAPDEYAYVYRASENGQLWESETENWKWRPSIHMPREAARLFLRVKSVGVEQLRNISEGDAIAEGVTINEYLQTSARGAFAYLWDFTYSKRGYGWNSNPWVHVIEFERIKEGEHGEATEAVCLMVESGTNIRRR